MAKEILASVSLVQLVLSPNFCFALEYKLLKVYILRAEVSDFLQIRADISEFLRYDVFRSFMDGDCQHCVSV